MISNNEQIIQPQDFSARSPSISLYIFLKEIFLPGHNLSSGSCVSALWERLQRQEMYQFCLLLPTCLLLPAVFGIYHLYRGEFLRQYCCCVPELRTTGFLGTGRIVLFLFVSSMCDHRLNQSGDCRFKFPFYFQFPSIINWLKKTA